MKRIAAIVTVAGGFLAGAGLGTDGPNEREFRELEKRVVAVEKGIVDVRRDVERLQRRDPDLQHKLRSLDRRLGDFEDASGRRASRDPDVARELAALEKRIEKDARRLSDRLNKRMLLLAEWFDEYHENEAAARYHRDQIGSIN